MYGGLEFRGNVSGDWSRWKARAETQVRKKSVNIATSASLTPSLTQKPQ